MAEWLSGERCHTAKHDVSCLVSAYVVGDVNHLCDVYFIYLVEKGKGHGAKLSIVCSLQQTLVFLFVGVNRKVGKRGDFPVIECVCFVRVLCVWLACILVRVCVNWLTK